MSPCDSHQRSAETHLGERHGTYVEPLMRSSAEHTHARTTWALFDMRQSLVGKRLTSGGLPWAQLKQLPESGNVPRFQGMTVGFVLLLKMLE